jgi:hypothetical protein
MKRALYEGIGATRESARTGALYETTVGRGLQPPRDGRSTYEEIR